MQMKIGILFGGQGRRMGGPKLSLVIDGIPSWQRMRDVVVPLSDQPVLMVVPAGTRPMLWVERIRTRGRYLLDVIALVQAAKSEPIMLINGDALLVTTKDLADFADAAEQSAADLVIPVVPKSSLPKEKQHWRRTNYMQGTLGMLPNRGLARGQVMFFRRPIAPDMKLIERMERNKVYGFIKIMGFDFFRIFSMTMTLGNWQKRFQSLFGGSVEFLECQLANLALDVDDRDDCEFLLEALKRRKS